MDKVLIDNLEVETIIGIYDWEREVRQVVSMDFEMDFDNSRPANSDSIEDALDYKKIAKRIISFSASSKSKLIENLAERITTIVLKEFPVKRIKLSVRKPGALRGSKSVGVTIIRP